MWQHLWQRQLRKIYLAHSFRAHSLPREESVVSTGSMVLRVWGWGSWQSHTGGKRKEADYKTSSPAPQWPTSPRKPSPPKGFTTSPNSTTHKASKHMCLQGHFTVKLQQVHCRQMFSIDSRKLIDNFSFHVHVVSVVTRDTQLNLFRAKAAMGKVPARDHGESDTTLLMGTEV